MDNLTAILKEEVSWYVGSGIGLNLRLLPVFDEAAGTYLVTSIDDPPINRAPAVVVMARVADDLIIIEGDSTDRPLYKHLLQAGVPREKIILAYAGETIPTGS